MIEIIILGLIISVIAVAILIFLYTLFQIGRPPANTPSEFLKRIEQTTIRKRVVLIGDSITHGRVGTNYVEILSHRMKNNKYELINAGINGDLVWNVCERLDEIVECRPDIIVILIGTNDANASLSPDGQRRYAQRKKLPTLPTHDWFRTMFRKLLTELSQRTDSSIGVLSLPTIGEDFDSFEFKESQRYSETIKEIAREINTDYIPLNEMMIENTQSVPSKTEYSSRKSEYEMVKAAMRYYILHETWDSISEKRGFSHHIDYLHLNTQGATLIADLIQQFLEESDETEGEL